MKKKVETIIIVCDSCGEHFVNGDGFTCYTDDPDGGNMLSEATSSGWLNIDGRQYCEDCWHYDDDDNIVCSDGRKYNGNTHEPVIERVNAADGTVQDGDIKNPYCLRNYTARMAWKHLQEAKKSKREAII